MSNYLPDGCTQEGLDRYYGGYDERPEEDPLDQYSDDYITLFMSDPGPVEDSDEEE